MSSVDGRRRTMRRGVAAACAFGASAALIATAGPAVAATKGLKVSYPVKGTSTVAKTGSVIALGPATLSAVVQKSGAITGSLPLPPTSTSFKLLGLLPVAATVTFIPDGAVTGQLTVGKKRTTVSSTAKIYINLSNVTVSGIPTPVGDSCQTSDPVALTVGTPKGKSFNLLHGGVLTGTYTIGDFANCGLTTTLINELIPGDGNTARLHLGEADFSS